MNIQQFFHRKKEQQQRKEPQPLRIEGIAPAPLTAEPDEAELAAQALLEMMSAAADKSRNNNNIPSSRDNDKADEQRDAVYYRRLADRIRQAHESARLRTVRFVAFVEHELKTPNLPLTGPGSLGLLEAELYKRIDVVERYGGDLKRRWQHCLAQVTVRIWRLQRPSEQGSDS